MSTFGICQQLTDYIVDCRPQTVGGVKRQIYIAKKSDIVDFIYNVDNSIGGINFVGGVPAFYEIDCRPNQSSYTVVSNGGDGAGSLNSTPTLTFSIDGFKQETMNISDILQTNSPNGLVVIFGTNEITSTGESRLVLLGASGDGLDVFGTTAAGTGTAKTDATGYTFTVSGTTLKAQAEITPTSGTNVAFIAGILHP